MSLTDFLLLSLVGLVGYRIFNPPTYQVSPATGAGTGTMYMPMPFTWPHVIYNPGITPGIYSPGYNPGGTMTQPIVVSPPVTQ